MNKYLAQHAGISRRRADQFILEGRVRVNGRQVHQLGLSVDVKADLVEYDGKRLSPLQNKRYILLNKPAGHLVTASDPQGRPTVYDLFSDIKDRLFSVGRLDQDTEGVLLLTDDGDLCQALAHPSHRIIKTYRVEVTGDVAPKDLHKLVTGIVLEDGVARAKRARVLVARPHSSELLLQLVTGKKRQVKRMCAAIGHPVMKLQRIAFAGLTVKGLPLGQWRHLTRGEIAHLKALAGQLSRAADAVAEQNDRGQKELSPSRLVVSIDGPGSSGKGTLGMLLAEKLGCPFVDTGAMYRALAVRALQLGLDLGDEERLGALAQRSEVRFLKPRPGDAWPYRISIDGQDVTGDIRTPGIDMASSRISAYDLVHSAMVEKQRQMAHSEGVVMEGRDIGTVVLPDADVKFFLTASLQERARRRHQQMKAWGRNSDPEHLERQLRQRDQADSQREVAPLRQADDAIVIDTTDLSIEQVLDKMWMHVKGKPAAIEREQGHAASV